MKTKKYFYGIRYLGGNRTCTTGEPNKITGRMSKAISVEVFLTKKDRDEWVNNENLSKPSGLGGGERIPATLREVREHSLGMSVEDFKQEIDIYKWNAENEED